jgi:hypothetical protein
VNNLLVNPHSALLGTSLRFSIFPYRFGVIGLNIK